ncbi:cyclic nucleotide-binding domain-containing protein [Cohnella sp. AR92]|uniref:cyclic nucleotide-binding domain-containing protein n=1 Tax=Cohnella sp. AR92 TaxID=648716 RepID=UPI000F8E3CD0|nr:cyclic nucleotide-binding domain-containing protein [Cohnella sp. AR92]RUS45912.1 cyclic nucleotide-binding domain-containing protein [Cohnella sp. AR92]
MLDKVEPRVLAKLQALFNLRYEDRHKVWIMGSVFFLAGLSEMVNYTSFMALFNSRVGTQYLPWMYLAEAVLMPLEGWAFSFLSQRLSKPRFMVSMYAFFISIGVVNGAVLLLYRMLDLSWLGFYVILFLCSNFVIRQQTLLMWSTAFDLCPTQQAKRVMPVFVLSAILGGIAAGVLTKLLAPLIGPEFLYLIAAGFLLAGLPNFLKSIKQYLLPLTFKREAEEEDQEERPSTSYYLKQSLRSPFLMTVIGIMTLMPAVYFLIEYQYFTSAQAVYTDEAELASFYGLMVIVLFCAAFLLQLFAARLIDWLGASNTIFAIAIVFLGSFGFVSLFIDSSWALAAVSTGYCLSYLLLYYFAEPSYQFFFKMLPLKHRDGFRYIAQGVAASAGVLLGSGASMLHTALGVSLTWQAIIGTIMAAVLFLLAWVDRHLYIKELVRYIQIGTTSVKDFMSEFLESMKNDRVKKTLLDQLRHPNETVQQLTIELFASNPDAAAADELLQYAERRGGRSRPEALSAIPASSWNSFKGERLEALIRDPDEEVRAIVYRRLFASSGWVSERERWIRKARYDESRLVQAEALRVIPPSESLARELRAWLGERNASSVLACDIIGERQLKEFYFDVMMCLLEPIPFVRNAAVKTLGRIGDEETATNLGELLIGADLELRAAIEQSFIHIGTAGMPVYHRFLSSPNDEVWRAAVSVINEFGTDKDIHETIVPSCIQKLRELRANRAYVERIREAGQEEWTELARLRSKELTQLLLDTIWTVMLRFGDERSIPQLRRALEGDDEETRDNGLEILSEGLGNAKLSAALLAFYQKQGQPESGKKPNRTAAQPSAEQENLMEAVTDPWLQAIAIKAGAAEGATALSNWEFLSALDKIVFLKQVPLFQDISIEELGRIASIAHERVYSEGDFLMKQGERASSMFVVVDGHVEIGGENEGGTVGTIGIIGTKQSIGEGGLFDERPSNVSAQVIFDQVRVLEIEGKEAARLVRLYPDVGVGLLRSIGNRLRMMEDMVLKLG